MNAINSISQQIQYALEGINKYLPAGITAKEAMFGNRRIIQYHVRYTQDGKKHSVGVFMTREAAITALVNHKVRKMIVVDASHHKRMEALYLGLVNSSISSFAEETSDIANTVAKTIKIEKELNLALMTEFMRIKPPHEIEAGKDYDFVWRVEDGGDDKLCTITAKMIRAWYAKIEEEAKIERLKKEQGYVSPLAESSPALQKESELNAEQLSDEEYNKLMGLDD